MHYTARFVRVAWLVLAAAGCSDDGLSVQDLNSSSTAGVGDSTANPTSPQTTADTLDGSGSGEGSMTGGTQGEGDTDASGGTSETPTSTTGDATTSVDTSVGTTEGTGTTAGTGTSEGSSSTGEACEPITEDPSGIGGECINDVDCPAGYTCQPFAGIVFQLSCQILCTQDCECPAGYTCAEIADKSGSTWHQCA